MIELVIDQRRKDLGGFEVGRVLPYAKRRMVGPFVFFDHMGPVDMPAGIPKTVDVRPHPHIGISTLTYLFDGEITHRDSLGVQQDIRPAEVNWMTAGSGINLLVKPYGQDELAARIRHLIRNRQQRAMLRDVTLASAEVQDAAGGDLLSRFGALRILLVEDSPETLHATTDLLEMLGHQVTPVASAEDALQALARDTFDVMCSDIELPGMSGQELARRVRRDYPQVGIIFASGYGARVGVPQVDAVILPKPYHVSDLENALEMVMLAR